MIEEMKKKTNKIKKKMKKRFKKKFTAVELAVIFSCTLILSLSFGFFLGYRSNAKVENLSYSEDFKKFADNYQYIIDNYYGDVDEKVLTDAAIKAILEAIGDPFSNYIDDEQSNFDVYLDGSFRGIGVEIRNNEDGDIRVDGVFEGSPAELAGIQVGDILIQVDDLDLRNKLPEELTFYVKEATKEMEFTILRNGEEIKKDIAKGLIIIKSVQSKVFEEEDKKIGYLRVDIFSATTYGQFTKELELLEKQNIDSLIIDFRDNSGGHLSVVSDMMSLFLKGDKIIYQTENKDEIEKIYSKGKIEKDYEIVFIANANTASAPEVMISAMKDNLGSLVVGQTTYGKGTVQELQSLPDGNKYKLTVKKWLTPNGVWIHEKGIKPDYEVILSEDYYNNPIESNDNQLKKALEILTK